MKTLNRLPNYQLTGLLLLVISLVLSSCRKDDGEEPIVTLYAKAEFTIQGQSHSFQAYPFSGGFNGIEFCCESGPDKSLRFFMQSTQRGLYYDEDYYGEGIGGTYEDEKYEFSMTQGNQSAKDFTLKKAVGAPTDGRIVIKVDTEYYESESGNMHVDVCKDQDDIYVLTYDSKGSFSGTFFLKSNPQMKFQIAGTWELELL